MDEVYRLRKFSTVLRIHSSSKKDGAEEYFAELQLYSTWSTEQLKTWEDPETCVKEYQERQKIINKVKTMTYPGLQRDCFALSFYKNVGNYIAVF